MRRACPISRPPSARPTVIQAVMVLALLLQTLIPAGFMPSLSGEKFALVICSGMGEKTVYVDTHPEQGEGKKAAGDSCAFALLHAPAMQTPAIAVDMPAVLIRIAGAAVPSAQIFFTPHRFSARGPPIFIL